MAWIIGKKSDESIVEISNKVPDFGITELQTVIPLNHGGVSGDYSYYQLPAADLDKIVDGWEYTITWAGNEITGVDFSTEENKRWIKVTVNKTEIDDDGVDSLTLRLEVWKADQSGIDTNVTASAKIPILTPNGEKWVKASVVNGVREVSFSTTKSGEWVVPSRVRFNNVRTMDQASFDVIETGVF